MASKTGLISVLSFDSLAASPPGESGTPSPSSTYFDFELSSLVLMK